MGCDTGERPVNFIVIVDIADEFDGDIKRCNKPRLFRKIADLNRAGSRRVYRCHEVASLDIVNRDIYRKRAATGIFDAQPCLPAGRHLNFDRRRRINVTRIDRVPPGWRKIGMRRIETHFAARQCTKFVCATGICRIVAVFANPNCIARCKRRHGHGMIDIRNVDQSVRTLDFGMYLGARQAFFIGPKHLTGHADSGIQLDHALDNGQIFIGSRFGLLYWNFGRNGKRHSREIVVGAHGDDVRFAGNHREHGVTVGIGPSGERNEVHGVVSHCDAGIDNRLIGHAVDDLDIDEHGIAKREAHLPRIGMRPLNRRER